MSLLGTLIRTGAQLGALAAQPRLTPYDLQYQQLLVLLQKAKKKDNNSGTNNNSNNSK